MTRRLYLLNGNSDTDLTAHLDILARKALPTDVVLESDTVASAPRYIASREDVERAAADIVSWAGARFADKGRPLPHGMVLACFGEPGLLELRRSLDVPVVGMFEAAALTAMQLGGRFSVLTTGAEWPDMLRELAAGYCITGRCAGYASLSADSVAASGWERSMQADLDAIVLRDAPDVVIVGGGPVSGRAHALSPPKDVRVVDAFHAAIGQALALMRQGISAQ